MARRLSLLLVVLGVVALLGASADARKRRRRQPSEPSFPSLTSDGLPNIQAASAIALDGATGGIYYAKDPDAARHIASTGKIFVAMVVRKRGIDLEASTEVNRIDHSFARGGARTKLQLGHAYRNRDLLTAMLIASDNRACTALGRAVGLDAQALIEAMNDLALELGLIDTHFTSPNGLRGNVSTAREMAKALQIAMADPVLRELLGLEVASIYATNSARPRPIHYRNTNRALHSSQWHVIGGKTGYTDAAGYCLIVAVEFFGREVYIVFLGVSNGRLTRYGDFNRTAQWMTSGETLPPAQVPRPAHIPTVTVGVHASGVGTL